MRRTLIAAAAAMAAVALAGCSQIGALTPVGGTAITSVRNATYDVLVDEGVEVLVAPVCEQGEQGFTCTGSTIGGDAIVATGGLTPPYDLRVEVGGEVIFEGTAQDVLAEALREGS